jgi:hypothetical protein
VPSGDCIDGLLEGECADAGGIWYPNTPCSDVTCVNAVEQGSWGAIKGKYR